MSGSAPLRLRGPAATDALGARLAGALAPGDVIGLSGPLGAGKSALARAILAARLAADGRAEDMPSPSYTLVQTYRAGGVDLLHADLYRLSDPEEALELGLIEAFDGAICLIEWPDRLGPFAPARRLEIALSLAEGGAARDLTATAVGSNWAEALSALTEAGRGDQA